ncbi:hypothetical protein ABE237_17000 [Brevibacillus formosus]|uniref:hypothetical protein n=1 Tax=Brevibacillus TaxID=55080 RepID=UPI000D0EB41E|nr:MULTISPECIES: hypothetical protein [Brevibacillus]MBG9944386.1 hypothetical protein [Brevibacillus formosus]MED1946271.1 hypothetical protein [Brevibacillus formosus]MED1998807.1 hypothetical protein [Brevibacillus formosus]MED2084136.1 hypothetical protein [Brevibacillus formosus]PSK18173.1 hypothetical protein C7R94_13450 [Brevibacillus sp. NRRL NRS-603]
MDKQLTIFDLDTSSSYKEIEMDGHLFRAHKFVKSASGGYVAEVEKFYPGTGWIKIQNYEMVMRVATALAT